MVVKREYVDSESGSEFEDEDEDVKPVITPTKKTKSTLPKTPTSSSKSSKSQSESGSASKKSKVDNSAKRTIAEEIINVGIKGINVDSLARDVRLFLVHLFVVNDERTSRGEEERNDADDQTGLTVQQVRSQVAGGGRANLRKQLMGLAMAL
jgi:hypothetical protein